MLNETFSVIFKYCPIVVTQSILSCKQKCTNCPWKWIGTDFSVEAAWQKKWGQSKKIYWPTYHTPLPADNQGWLRGHNVGKWLKKSRFINVSKASYIDLIRFAWNKRTLLVSFYVSYVLVKISMRLFGDFQTTVRIVHACHMKIYFPSFYPTIFRTGFWQKKGKQKKKEQQ